MLNELHWLVKALDQSGIAPPDLHPGVQRPGKSTPALWVRLTADGSVGAVNHLEGSSLACLWTLGEGNQKRFPFVQPKKPVVAIPTSDSFWHEMESADRKGDHAQQLALLERLDIRADHLSGKGLVESLLGLQAAVRARGDRLRGAETLVTPILELHDRYLRATVSDGSCRALIVSIAREAVRQAKAGQIPVAVVRGLLVGKRKSGEVATDCALFFDVYDLNDPSSSVTRADVPVLLSQALEETEAESVKGLDSLTGEVVDLEIGPFPEPTLPVLGKTRLFSMFAEAGCQFRYGHTGSSVFPTGRSVARRMKNALEWATSQERQRITWCRIPSGHKDGTSEKHDLLIAYPESKPDLSGPLAELFGGPGAERALFEETSQLVFKALSSHGAAGPAERIRMMVLRKADPARRQLVFALALTAEQVFAASAEWQIAARNHPRFAVPMPGGRGEKAQPRQPGCPYPGEVVTALQRQWFRSGTDSGLLAGCSWREALDLFTEPSGGPSGVAPRLLALAVMRWSPLLVGLSHARRIGADKAWKAFEVGARESALRAVALLGILLYKVGRTKGAYVNDAMYTVGQLLSLADLLHLEYCRKRRRGDVPNQLIGNALIPAAAESPTRAVARLLDRLRVYQAWAQTARESNPGELRLARWALGRLGDVSTRLHDVSLPVVVSDAGKAELLLGYLAGAARETGDPQNEPTPETEVTTDGN